MALFASVTDLGDFLGEELTGTRLTQAATALEMASAQIQGWTRQRLERVVDDEVTLAGGPGWELELPEAPVIDATVTSIDGVVPTSGSYRLIGTTLIRPGGWTGPGLVAGNVSWPVWDTITPALVNVTYTHGFDPIPDDIVAACLQMAARCLQSPSGIRQESIGAYSVTYGGDVGGGLLGAAEVSLLGRYRRRGASVVIR